MMKYEKPRAKPKPEGLREERYRQQLRDRGTLDSVNSRSRLTRWTPGLLTHSNPRSAEIIQNNGATLLCVLLAVNFRERTQRDLPKHTETRGLRVPARSLSLPSRPLGGPPSIPCAPLT